MIEKDFNELDNDFLKVWSQYLLDGDWNAHKKDIEKLAELGQINAVAEYYNSNPEQVNPVIDKNLKENESEDFNIFYAKAMRARNEETKSGEFFDVLKRLKAVSKRLDEDAAFMRMNASEMRTMLWDRNSLFNQKIALEEKIKSFEFVKYLNLAVSACFDAWKKTKNPVFLENYCEIGLKYREIMFGENRSAAEHIGEARRFLWRAFCKNIHDPAVKFAYGKNMLLFSKGEEKKEGVKFLKSLTTTKHSETMKNHCLNATRRK